MIGKRTPDGDNLAVLEPGAYGLLVGSLWYATTPNGHLANLSKHDVVEHDDRTVTVSPSILVFIHEQDLWHGWLERGVWREA